MPSPIFVIGATGMHGGTGLTVAKTLLENGGEVRVLARKETDRTAALEALGAEVCIGDLLDRRTLLPALKGVETAYFTYPVAPGVIDAAANFASAAQLVGVNRVVVMSMAVSNPHGPSHFGRAHWLAEETLRWSGLSCLFLRIVSLFFENIPLLHGRDILSSGLIRNSFSGEPLPWIAAEDAGNLAAAALLSPERFSSTVLYPTGGFYYTHSEIAGMLSKHFGKTIRHEAIAEHEWRSELESLGTEIGLINADMARHIACLGTAMRGPMSPLNNLFKDIVGRDPISFEDALAHGKISFDAPHLNTSTATQIGEEHNV